MDEATKKANEMRVESIFREKRKIQRNRRFEENDRDEVKQSVEESLGSNTFYFFSFFFLFIIHQVLFSLKTQFEQFKQYKVTFGFLFKLNRLRRATFFNLLKSFMNLEKHLSTQRTFRY